MPNTPLTIVQVLTMLAAAPPRLASLTGDMDSARLHVSSGPDEWSANDVLAHLRSCADVWGGCIVTILTEDRPTLRAINPRTWIRQTDYPVQAFPLSLEAFTRQRAELLTLLEPLPPAAWARSAAVTGAGRVLERTVLFYAQWLARHERPHLKQIARIVAAARAE